MVSMLWNQPPDPRDAQLPLRFISAAPIAAEVYRDIEKRYGCRIVTMYGLTEAFPIAVKGVADDGVPGTSGRPNPNFDVRIVDPDGEPLPDGTVGEIACRPRYPHVMSEGYESPRAWARRPAPAVVSHRRSRRAGQRPEPDLRRPGEGLAAPPRRERLVGRGRDGGDCGIRRCSRPRWSAYPATWARTTSCCSSPCSPTCDLDYAELLDFCGARMPYFCVPRYVEIVSEMPKTVIGRVRKDVLRSRGVGPRAWDRESHGYVVSR